VPVLVSGVLGALACGGTTGQPDQPPQTTGGNTEADSDVDGTLGAPNDAAAEAGTDAPVDAGTFDVEIEYADRPLPDVYVAEAAAMSSSSDDGGGLKPCTTAGQTGCVTCNGNASGLCSPTEAALVQHDIAAGLATAPGPDPGDSCYGCLFNGSCIDDTVNGDVSHECEDTIQTFGSAALCEATIACLFSTSCAKTAVITCYCGTAGPTTACQGAPAPGPINGACASVIAAGLGFQVTDGTDNTAKLENTAYAAGKADQIFQCGIANGCTRCQQ
jgi:hypothetical protein